MSGSAPIHVLAAAFATLSGGGLIEARPPALVHGAARIAGDGSFTNYRGREIDETADLVGRVDLKLSLTGVLQGPISLKGRLKPTTILIGVVQGDQE